MNTLCSYIIGIVGIIALYIFVGYIVGTLIELIDEL